MQQPLAIAIISGFIVQLPLVLCVMPILFDLTQRRGDRDDRLLTSQLKRGNCRTCPSKTKVSSHVKKR
jgi:hypothetical protein